jgi:nucleotide-binding universal stress UspA family protein
MSTHGRSGVERWVRGSVAERVLRRATVPLLLANPFSLATRLGETAPPFQKILVPLDGSDGAMMVLPRVEAIARLFSAEVILLHVVPGLPFDADLVGALEERELEGLGLLERATNALPRATIRVRLEHGIAADAILQTVVEEDVDLLAMTTHGRHGPLVRWTFGAVAEDVFRHARCPVLVERVAVPAVFVKRKAG